MRRFWAVAFSLCTMLALVGPARSSQATSSDGVITYSRGFVGGGKAICVLDPATSETAIVRRLDLSPETPVLSPSGTKIAFSSYVDDEYQLFVVDVAGGDPVPLGEGYREPSWTPDGSAIAIWGIHLVPIDGTERRFVIGGASPDISPDGTQVTYDSGVPEPQPTDGPNGTISVADIDGTDERHLVSGEYPEWSPDGSEIAYRSGGYWSNEISVIGAEGSGHRNLTSFGYVGAGLGPNHPHWSPDGDRVAFVYDGSIWTVPAQGGDPRRITDFAAIPNWTSEPPDATDLWDGPPCEDPRRRVSLRLRGHLFGTGRVWPARYSECSIEGVDVELERKMKPPHRYTLAGRGVTNVDGRFRIEVDTYTPNGYKRDLPGSYRAVVFPDEECLGSRTRWKFHRH